ncbi:Glycosyl transferase, family 2 [Trichormus variabilis ATCC 29413]|uniref:Glycosyl transferase, family 2 n=2 Tax=Anabaena variabilis TaxID=264691 RepID=Q3MEW3_TRIV2|nr:MULTISPECIES: glycosyltransferase family A protein [Nostocaceae]ABA20473.1 Glycosyl transferase, family 2 [Trichormus variabilis ATCC 29413]MBC1215802.1 glycosyltransferase family 2 protein [Trichormus variabilis ARAD]MBC1257921.1 glycosyltransferase family 2 protein [Trichormus variabilis V5]MBC1267980.1 glycosyltransferase family 2 protein [Trichormus variabilis FSR]MBC1304376.1 glycosyltransferase family 2 protein [Trichormus variabilis N2B]
MPKVSVVIPAYNAMPYLPETLDSVLRQTYNDFEVIVVNDGSSDKTEEFISQILDPRIKLISQANQGLAGARNTGILNASGEYIAFLDADDIWEPTKLEKQVKVLDENPEVGLVYTWVAYINEQGKSTGKIFKNQVEGYVWPQLTEHNIVECGSVAMVRQICFEKIGLFDRNLGSYVEDWDMWLRIATSYDFKVVKEALVYYRQRSNSASKNWEAMAQSFAIVIEKAFATASPDLQVLKNKSYGFTYLCLAWKPLQSLQKDYQKSREFCQQALVYYPSLRFSQEYIRLSIAINLMRWFGADGYSKLLPLFHTMRRVKLALQK